MLFFPSGTRSLGSECPRVYYPKCCIYALVRPRKDHSQIVYIGKTTGSLRTRLSSHFRNELHLGLILYQASIRWNLKVIWNEGIPKERLAQVEKEAIEFYAPMLNCMGSGRGMWANRNRRRRLMRWAMAAYQRRPDCYGKTFRDRVDSMPRDW